MLSQIALRSTASSAWFAPSSCFRVGFSRAREGVCDVSEFWVLDVETIAMVMNATGCRTFHMNSVRTEFHRKMNLAAKSIASNHLRSFANSHENDRRKSSTVQIVISEHAAY